MAIRWLSHKNASIDMDHDRHLAAKISTALIRNAGVWDKVLEYIKNNFGSVDEAFDQLAALQAEGNPQETQAGALDRAKAWALAGLLGLAMGISPQEVLAGNIKDYRARADAAFSEMDKEFEVTPGFENFKVKIFNSVINLSADQIQHAGRIAWPKIFQQIKPGSYRLSDGSSCTVTWVSKHDLERQQSEAVVYNALSNWSLHGENNRLSLYGPNPSGDALIVVAIAR